MSVPLFSNAYPQLQTACTSGKSAETALLYCVSTSNSVTLIHSCRLQRLVEVQRKQLYYTVIVPLSQQRLSTAADYCVNPSIWGTVMHSCRLHILLEVQQKQLYSTVSVPLSQERLSRSADCIYQWKVTGNSFTLLCQYLHLRNACPQLRIAYTSERSTETALLFCVSTSISATVIHSYILL